MQDYDSRHFTFVRNSKLQPHHFRDKQMRRGIEYVIVILFGVLAGLLSVSISTYF